MSLTAAAIRLMASKGMSAEDIAEIAEAMEKPIPELSAAALRTRKWREKKDAEKAGHHGDVTVTHHGDVSPTCERAQVVIPSSSLRSEDKPRLPSGASPTKPKPARSRLVPDSWSPSPRLLADLATKGFTPGEIERELANFRDHEFRDPKSDFDRTFRRWMRQSQNFQPRKAHDRTDHPASSRAARRGVWAEIAAEECGEGPGCLTGTG